MLEKAREKLRMAEECYNDAIEDYQREITVLQALRDNIIRTRQGMEPAQPARSHLSDIVPIRSFSKAMTYSVRLYGDPVDDTCECPDFKYRHRTCKHIYQAREQKARGTVFVGYPQSK